MKNIKLLAILKTFSKEEIRLFEKFTASPYHKSGKNCYPLLRELKKHHPEFESEHISYEKLYSKLYPEKNYNQQVMWNLISALEKAAVNFLEHEAFRKSYSRRKELLVAELIERKLSDHTRAALREIDKLFKGRLIDNDYLDDRLRQGESLVNFSQSENNLNVLSNVRVENMEYYILNFMRFLKSTLEDQALFRDLYNKKYERNIPLEFAKRLDLESIVKYCESKKYKYSFYLKIIYYSIMTILEPKNANHFFSLRKLFDRYHRRLGKREKRVMIVTMVNYCISNKNIKNPDYFRIMFELNKIRLKEGLAFYPENQISKQLYVQILFNSLGLNETEWTKEFIKNYTPHLNPQYQNSMKSLADAYLKFAEKNFEEVLSHLNKVNFTDVRDKIHVRTLTARTFYELNETESLISYIDASKRFLINNASINETKRKAYGNFFYFLSRLTEFKSRAESFKAIRESAAILKKNINSENNLEYKQWLLAKADDLKIKPV